MQNPKKARGSLSGRSGSSDKGSRSRNKPEDVVEKRGWLNIASIVRLCWFMVVTALLVQCYRLAEEVKSMKNCSNNADTPFC